MNNSNRRPRIDSSTPKSFYCSPKSCHYIPFAKRRSQSYDFKKQTEDMSCQKRRCSKALGQRSPCLFTKHDTDLLTSSSSLGATFTNSNRSGRPMFMQSRNDQLQLRDEQQSEKKIPSEEMNRIYGNNVEEVEDKLDHFKNDILDDIIQCGVYTDSVIQECVSRNVIENSTLTTADLQRAISELLSDIGVFNIEVNKMTQIANSETSEKLSYYDGEQFDSDEGEPLPVVASVGSGSDKLAKEYKAGSASTTDSSATLSNSSDTFN